MEKKERKAEWKQQYQKRKGYFKEYYQKHKDVMDANSKKNAKKYREEYKHLEEENKKLKHKNELQLKALIKLCLKHHYDSIIIEGEEVIDMSNYKVVEKKKPQEEKLF